MTTKISTGIEGLDKMLHGGLIAHRPYLVTGPIGSGKTTLGIQFLLEGLKNHESVLLVTVDEPPNEIKDNMSEFGFDLSMIKILDATPDIRSYQRATDIMEIKSAKDIKTMKDVGDDIRKSSVINPYEISIQAIYLKLKKELEEHHYDRLVIDSLTALKLFGIRAGFSEKDTEQREVQSLLRFLSESGVTTLITSELPAEDTLDPEFFLTRGEIRLHKIQNGGNIIRGVTVERLRGSSHELDLWNLEIGKSGITVQPPPYYSDSKIAEEMPEETKAAIPEEMDVAEDIYEDIMLQVESVLEDCLDANLDVSDLEELIARANAIRSKGFVKESLESMKKIRLFLYERIKAHNEHLYAERVKSRKDIKNIIPIVRYCPECGSANILFWPDGTGKCSDCQYHFHWFE